MKLVDKSRKHPPFDAPSGLAEALIAAGTAEKYEEPAPKKLPPDTEWRVVREPMRCNDGVSFNSSYISARCHTCQQAIQMSGPTCHRTQQFRHCGIAESVPDNIAREYTKALREPLERHEEKITRRQERERQPVPANW